MSAPWPPPAPVAVLLPTEEPTLPPTVRYGLPASWEDCVALGLDPLGSDRTWPCSCPSTRRGPTT